MRSNNQHSTTNSVNIVQTVALGLLGAPVTLGLFWAMNAFVEFAAESGLWVVALIALLATPVVLVVGSERL